jgi:predicted Zn-dependent peptidase
LPEVRNFFETHYLPNNAVVTLVGDFEPDPALELVNRYLGAIPAGAAPGTVEVARGATSDGPRRAELEDDVPAPKLFLGCLVQPFGTDEWATADFTADLLTSGAASRLQRRLIRELRLADEVEAAAYPLAAGNALLEIDVTASEDANPEEVEAALYVELDRLAAEPPTAEELSRVSLRRETDRAVTMQESGERAERIGMYACLLDEPERFGREAEADRSIGADAIADLARGPLSDRNRVVLWYLPSGE